MTKNSKRYKPDPDLYFIGDPVPTKEATITWPNRYSYLKKQRTQITPKSREDIERVKANQHFLQACIDGVIFNIGDDVFVTAEGKDHYIAKIIELFEARNGEPYFRARWFYRAKDTVIADDLSKDYIQEKRLFLSNVENDNPLDCIFSGVKIKKCPLKTGSLIEEKDFATYDFFYNMNYEFAYRTFSTGNDGQEASSTISNEHGSDYNENFQKKEMFLLDLYSGCGAMSTGLAMGCSLAGVKLTTKWAVDFNKNACDSLKLNHPETMVRNEDCKDFLKLLKLWRNLCLKFGLIPREEPFESDDDLKEYGADVSDLLAGEFQVGERKIPAEVEEFMEICYRKPEKAKKAKKSTKAEKTEQVTKRKKAKKSTKAEKNEQVTKPKKAKKSKKAEKTEEAEPPSELYLLVRWRGHGAENDTWVPYHQLRACVAQLKDFVTKGFKSNLLPLPGDTHFVCGGPPCQGVSGNNRKRNYDDPLADPKNSQMIVYMDIINFLKPKHTLMENVIDLFRFKEGFLGRYAVARLVAMNYQTRIGMMAAGSYGVAQVRNRVFVWGALPTEKLPPYPLPTHDISRDIRLHSELRDTQVGFLQKDTSKLKKGLTLGDAISDLPILTNDEKEDKRDYEKPPTTDFQKIIRLPRAESIIRVDGEVAPEKPMLYDHQPLKLSQDDLDRVRLIPKKKGANFRDLRGLIVRKNVVSLDDSIKRPELPSGKPLVPNYAISFEHGTSKKPFGRIWTDERVGTVVTRGEPHNQIICHPFQDRVLGVREIARFQGFPDFYKLSGTIKEKYIQVGNAVAIPVGIALGYAYGMTCRGLSGDKPVIDLPFEYPECLLASNTEEHSG